MERHIQTIMSGVIIMLLAWVGNNAVETSRQTSSMSTQIDVLIKQFDRMEERVSRIERDR